MLLVEEDSLPFGLAFQLRRVIRYLPDSLIQDAIELAAIVDNDSEQDQCLAEIAYQIPQDDYEAFYSIWTKAIERGSGLARSDMLDRLQYWLPALVRFGGEESVVTIFHAVRDIAKWWP